MDIGIEQYISELRQYSRATEQAQVVCISLVFKGSIPVTVLRKRWLTLITTGIGHYLTRHSKKVITISPIVVYKWMVYIKIQR